MFKLIPLILICIFFQGCDLRSREAEIEKREGLLLEREQKVSLKEKELQLRENELLKRESQSGITKDSTNQHPDIPGRWNVKMTCTETSCTGSAVGDTKSETWELSFQNNHIVARALEGNKLVRVYTGLISGNSIELQEDIAHTNISPATSLKVRLNIINSTTMEGEREIIRQNACKIIYQVQMNKQ